MRKMSKEQTTISHYLRDVGSRLGIADMALDERGLCVVQVEGVGRIRIEVPAASTFCYLAVSLMQVPAAGAGRDRLLTKAMTMNYFGKDTQHATLSLDSESAMLFLHAAFAINTLDARLLENILCNFLDVVGTVRAELEAPLLSQAQKAAALTDADRAVKAVSPLMGRDRVGSFA